jgi:HK97 family phage major capsid protein/HK97 family phage prohead protease
MQPITKYVARQSADDPLEFILSDETVDRYGDIIEAKGWELDNFKSNPIALFGHDNSFPIGVWENVRVQGKKLMARLAPAATGTSHRVDEIISLVKQRVLKAASVGFKPLAAEPIAGTGGLKFTKQELLETSIVSVPANPAALAVAKALQISPEVQREVFGKTAEHDFSHLRRSPGESANPTRSRGTNMKLSERIQAAQTRLAALQDQLEKHVEGLTDSPTQEDNDTTAALNEQVGEVQETLGNLVEAEKRLKTSIERSVTEGGAGASSDRKPFALPAAKKAEPIDYIFRALAAKMVSHINKTPLLDTIKGLYGEDEVVRSVAGIVIDKAAVAPADTVTPAWAGALVQTAIGDFFDLLLPTSVYPNLSAIGGRFGFGRNGTVSLPTRSATPTVAGSFVGEGSPIPVRKAGFTSITLTPKKMAVITTMTREITERSTPDIEALLRNAIQEDTAVSIDAILLDANAATSVRPAGLRNGITTAAGTAGGGIAAVVADVKGMLTTLLANTNGNVRNPVWIMNPIQALALSLLSNSGGDGESFFPFAAEIDNNRFRGYPLIQSSTVPAGVVILIDAADFFSATGDDPRFDVSDQAVLHMEDTSPAQIGTTGTPNVVAAPVQSMFQTDALALRMILPMSWALRRTGIAVERTAVTW